MRQSQQHTEGNIEVTMDITNSGSRKGDEVVQLYLKDKVSSVTTYEYDLGGFERVTLNPGQTKTVKFTIQPDDMALLDKNNKWTVEPGEFEVMIGSSSTDIKLSGEHVIRELRKKIDKEPEPALRMDASIHLSPRSVITFQSTKSGNIQKEGAAVMATASSTNDQTYQAPPAHPDGRVRHTAVGVVYLLTGDNIN